MTISLPKQSNCSTKMKSKQLLPFNEIDKDPVRWELDEKFATNVLHLGSTIVSARGALELPRRKLSPEPSIAGQKSIPQ